jgi:hypothetical protein
MTTQKTGNQLSEATKTAEAAANTAAETGTQAAKVAAEAVTSATDEAVRSATDEAVRSATDNVIDALVTGQSEATRALESTSRTMLDGMTRMRQEIVDFVSTRVRHDIETQQELLRCRNFDDVREVQTKFFQTATEQYVAESKRLMELGSEVFHQSVDRSV